MRIVHRDRKAGLVKVVPEVLDDLYHLAQIVRPRDRVRALTFRTAEVDDDVERRGKAEKRKMVLTLEVEDVEFHEFSDRLRIHGVITDGPQDHGLHHTFNVEADGRGDLSIVKPDGWHKTDLERLDRAAKEAQQPLLFILAIEDDEATLAAVHHYGVREVSSIQMGGRGKMYETKGKDGFFDEVRTRVVTTRPPEAPLIVVGPGWTRERFIDHLRERAPEHAGGLSTEGTGQGGIVGVHEAIRRGVLQRVVKDHALTRDTELMDRLLAEIARGAGLAAYGPQETLQALEVGAVDTLLVTDRLVREGRADDALRRAEETATAVHVLAEAHDAGKRLGGFGGVAALLRFRIDA